MALGCVLGAQASHAHISAPSPSRASAEPHRRTRASKWCAHALHALQRAYSVAEITTSETYEKGKPKLGGLSDPRLGTMDRLGVCTTDGGNANDSPGYFGHIALSRPVYHIGFIKTVVRVLRCVSYSTSRLLVDKVRSNSSSWQPWQAGPDAAAAARAAACMLAAAHASAGCMACAGRGGRHAVCGRIPMAEK